MNSARDEIISRIKNAISLRKNEETEFIDSEISVYHETNIPILQQFALEFEKVSGEIIICDDINEISKSLKKILSEKEITKLFCVDSSLQKLPNLVKIPYLSERDDFETMEAGLTGCEYLIAQTGSVIVSSSNVSGRRLNVFPPVHIVYAKASQIIKDMNAGIINIANKYGDDLPSFISTITGPSRTADIEKTLVMGAHGPKEVIILLNLEKK